MKLDTKLSKEIEESLNQGVTLEDCAALFKIKEKKLKFKEQPFNTKKLFWLSSLIVVLLALNNPEVYQSPKDFLERVRDDYFYSSTDKCLVGMSALSMDMTRPVSNCNICRGITEVPIVQNMTREYFLKHHAYTGAPVLVKGGASNWTALNMFSYKYFKLLYSKLDALKENDELGCQFFPYKTNFATLEDVFKMSKKRAAFKKDQWYIGWSNCVPRVMKALRRHYSRPEFLPQDSESSYLDWMFMGGSGRGAMMHIDAVNRPSWQAMIKGKKTWTIEPPPECSLECSKRLQATMEPGDILVIDTNKWYHSTFIHPGSISITIGSEYD
ncbi:uncharacterized protein [Clytia hemisphaerica]|uniref:uncharacterized protein n=1 Tax=Clytia hemisphaerica TaxID=252671 RepID=UPI0034D60D4F